MTRTMNHKNARHGVLRLLALTVVVSMPLVGVSGVASAHVTKAAKHHHKKGSGGSSTGTGKPTAPEIVVSAIGGVVQVEANPQFADDPVNITSTQLAASCGGSVTFLSVATGTLSTNPPGTNFFTVNLDNDGNATVILEGTGNCAPGDNIVDASLNVAPYYTALTDYVNSPDFVTPAAAFAFPDPEVETGDTNLSGNSDVYADFAVETLPVYAEESAAFSDTQLESSCGGGYFWIGAAGVEAAAGPVGPGVPQVTTAGHPPLATIDDDGNAGLLFLGISCAANTSTIVADVQAGDHPTYTGSYTVLPPQPTI